VERLVDLLMLLICVFVVWYGTRLCVETMGQSIAELPWLPVGVTYAAIPLGALATLLFVLERMAWGPQTQRSVVRFGEAH
jgi:TRAP-type C4-dicarboxylate transport system permease small subunit